MINICVNHDDYNFANINELFEFLEDEYGFEGTYWGMIKENNDLKVLVEFLNEDGIYCEINN